MSENPQKVYLLTYGEWEDWTVDSFVYTRKEAEAIVKENKENNKVLITFQEKVSERARFLGLVEPVGCFHHRREVGCEFPLPKPTPPPPGVSQRTYLKELQVWKTQHNSYFQKRVDTYKEAINKVKETIRVEMGLSVIPDYKTEYSIVKINHYQSNKSHEYSGRDAAIDNEKEYELNKNQGE